MNRSNETLENLTLSERQEKAVLALVTCKTRTEAAKQAGVSRETLYLWLKDRDFCDALMVARRSAFSEATTRAAGLACEAIDVLAEVMRDKQQPGAVRVSAARAVAELAAKNQDIDELQGRLAELERLASGGRLGLAAMFDELSKEEREGGLKC